MSGEFEVGSLEWGVWSEIESPEVGKSERRLFDD